MMRANRSHDSGEMPFRIDHGHVDGLLDAAHMLRVRVGSEQVLLAFGKPGHRRREGSIGRIHVPDAASFTGRQLLLEERMQNDGCTAPSSRRLTVSRWCPNGEAPAMNGCGRRKPRYDVAVSMAGPSRVRTTRFPFQPRVNTLVCVLDRVALCFDEVRHSR